jgi:hypothetical protein
MNETMKGAFAPFLLPKTRRLITYILIAFLLMVLGMEGLFRILDPFGLQRAVADLHLYYAALVMDNGLYMLPDGEYRFSNWTARMVNGARWTASPDSDCTIAFVGDSVTFGLGVDDSAVWVNRLAIQYPDVTMLNKGLPGYNSSDVLESTKRTTANGYVYLIFDNDSDAPLQLRDNSYWLDSALQHNVFLLTVSEKPRIATESFLADIAALPDNVLLLGFEGEPLAIAANARLIPRYIGRISRADVHADRSGNEQLADSMLPFIAPFVTRICNG